MQETSLKNQLRRGSLVLRTGNWGHGVKRGVRRNPVWFQGVHLSRRCTTNSEEKLEGDRSYVWGGKFKVSTRYPRRQLEFGD